jgi:hypothetical protein
MTVECGTAAPLCTLKSFGTEPTGTTRLVLDALELTRLRFQGTLRASFIPRLRRGTRGTFTLGCSFPKRTNCQ